jgi:hypothetical protein
MVKQRGSRGRSVAEVAPENPQAVAATRYASSSIPVTRLVAKIELALFKDPAGWGFEPHGAHEPECRTSADA